VRGHSARQLRASAKAVPGVALVAGATRTANNVVTWMRFRILNSSTAEGLYGLLSASGSRSASISLFARSSEKVTGHSSARYL
jgi:hypothetical protein